MKYKTLNIHCKILNAILEDFYDKKRNIVVEYDEPHHFTPERNLKKKDKERQRRIIESLKCRFYRFNELTRKLKNV